MNIGLLVNTAWLAFGERRVSRMICILKESELLGGGIVRLIVVVAIGVLRCICWCLLHCSLGAGG